MLTFDPKPDTYYIIYQEILDHNIMCTDMHVNCNCQHWYSITPYRDCYGRKNSPKYVDFNSKFRTLRRVSPGPRGFSRCVQHCRLSVCRSNYAGTDTEFNNSIIIILLLIIYRKHTCANTQLTCGRARVEATQTFRIKCAAICRHHAHYTESTQRSNHKSSETIITIIL